MSAPTAAAPTGAPLVPDTLTLRLRPGVGAAPIRNGIRFQHWDTTFRLQGHPALHALYQRLLPQLTQGATRAALLGALPTGAQTAARLLLDELGARHLLLEQAPEHAEEAAGPHAPVRRFLDSLSDDPRAAFRAVRAAHVTVRGPHDLAQAVAAHLRDLAFGTVDVQPDQHPFAALHLGHVPGAPVLLATLGATQGVIAPLGAAPADLGAASAPPGDPGAPEPLRQLLAGLLALELFRVVAALPTGVTDTRALVVDAGTLRSSPVPAFLRRATPDAWWHLAQAPARASAADAAALLAGPFALAPQPTASGDQVPLFTYGVTDEQPGGWGTDGTQALHHAVERRLLSLLTAPPVPVPATEVAYPVLAYSGAQLRLRAVSALLAGILARQPETFTGRPLQPRDLPGEHLWLLKTLGMVYGLSPQVTALAHPALRGLHGAAVYSGGRLLACAFDLSADEAVRAALIDAVATQQLALPIPGTPPPGGEVPGDDGSVNGGATITPDQAAQATWDALHAEGRAPRLLPDLTVPGAVQCGVLMGWVIARA